MTQDNKKVSQITKEALSVELKRQERQERVTEVLQGAGFDPEFYRFCAGLSAASRPWNQRFSFHCRLQ